MVVRRIRYNSPAAYLCLGGGLILVLYLYHNNRSNSRVQFKNPTKRVETVVKPYVPYIVEEAEQLGFKPVNQEIKLDNLLNLPKINVEPTKETPLIIPVIEPVQNLIVKRPILPDAVPAALPRVPPVKGVPQGWSQRFKKLPSGKEGGLV